MSAEPKGPLWLPTWQVERMMRDCRDAKEAGKTKCEIDTASLEGLLHDSLLWRQERITQQGKPCVCPPNGASYACPTHGVLNGKAVSMSKSNDELIARLEKILGMSVPMGTDAAGHSGIEAECRKALELARAEPPRAPPGTLEIGITPDEREVIMNMPHTPDNGTGFVHFAFTPMQAFALGEKLIKKAGECK